MLVTVLLLGLLAGGRAAVGPHAAEEAGAFEGPLLAYIEDKQVAHSHVVRPLCAALSCFASFSLPPSLSPLSPLTPPRA